MIKMAMSVARWTCSLPTDVTGTVKVVDMAFLKYIRDQGNYVAPDRQDKSREDFKGAVVYDTISGIHKNVLTVDLTALYPSIMRILGLSTETLIMQLVGEDLAYYKVIERSKEFVGVYIEETGETIEVAACDVMDLIRENGYTISASGTIYNGEMGMLAGFVETVFMERKRYQKMMRETDNENERNKHDLFQKVLKTTANSCYGAISNVGFRLFDIRMARSITYSGKIVSKFMAWKTNETIREIVNGDI